MAKPASTTNDILSRVESLKVGQVNFDSIEVASLQRDIRALRKSFPADAYMLEGILNAKAMNAEASVSAHKKSIEISSDPYYLSNFATSLVKLNRFAEGLECRDKAIEAGYTNINSVSGGVWINTVLLRFRRAKEIMDKFGGSEIFDRAIEENDYYNELRKRIPEFLSFSESNNISLDQIEIVGQHIADAISNLSCAVRLNSIEMSDFYGSPFINIIFCINDSAEKVHELNMSLVESIASDERVDCWDRVVPEFRVLPNEAMHLVD